MTLNGVMALILRYFAEFGSFRGALRKSSRLLSHLLMSSCNDTIRDVSVNMWLGSLLVRALDSKIAGSIPGRRDKYWDGRPSLLTQTTSVFHQTT